MLKGVASNKNLEILRQQIPTVEPARRGQSALSVLAHMFMRDVGTDTAQTGSTRSRIAATAHAAHVGDVIRFTSGNLSGVEIKVELHASDSSMSADEIPLAEELSEAPANGDTFQILRHKYPVVNASGELLVSQTIADIALVDTFDTSPVLDASSTTINGSAGAFVEVVASLAAACKRIIIANATGQNIGLYTGAAGNEVLALVLNNTLTDVVMDFAIPGSTRISLRAIGPSSITAGSVSVQFLG